MGRDPVKNRANVARYRARQRGQLPPLDPRPCTHCGEHIPRPTPQQRYCKNPECRAERKQARAARDRAKARADKQRTQKPPPDTGLATDDDFWAKVAQTARVTRYR